ncbi:unnamed protein product [Paramecium pentaurelia]|uniref:Uncharacterized protein n=1 Tax=Paramecium pentaurelia TaxID=43138 RepID=A0A8S1SPU2_9CILI|nr:unnamed protein product [Paramecium pentaurelia]
MGEIVANQLFVAGYSRSKVNDDKDVKEIFKKYGTIKDVAYKGAYSFVTFSNEQEAQEALKATNGETFNGQKLKVDLVDNRKGRKNGPNEQDKCFKCNKGGHWARNCPNKTSPRRSRKRSNSRSKRRHRRSRSRSYSSNSSSSRRRYQNRRNKHSRSPRRDMRQKKRSISPRRSHSDSGSSKRQISKS